MTSVIEKLIGFLAPNRCVGCGNYDNVLCASCLHDAAMSTLSCCVLCQRPTVQWRVCPKCAKATALVSVYPFARYEGAVAAVIKRLKFEHARSGARSLAVGLDAALPYLEPEWVVVPVPTAAMRIRERGYDQAILLARELARLRGLSCARLLVRTSGTRQLGATRRERQRQARELFTVKGVVRGKCIVLVDDVCTTGATLMAAARELHRAGAATIIASVVAWQPPD